MTQTHTTSSPSSGAVGELVWQPSKGTFRFSSRLLPARIINRQNRFIANIWLDGKQVKAHCPVTGTIGGFKLDDLPCLVSGPYLGKSRKTQYTLEAIGVPSKTVQLSGSDITWVGINQTRANSFVYHALIQNQFSELFPHGVEKVRREVPLGSSRLDFLITEFNGDRTFIEVKSPLKNLQLELGRGLKVRNKNSASTERMVRQIRDLTVELSHAHHTKAILLTNFVYDNPGFEVPKRHQGGSTYREISQALEAAKKVGLERWQANFELLPSKGDTELRVTKCQEIDF